MLFRSNVWLTARSVIIASIFRLQTTAALYTNPACTCHPYLILYKLLTGNTDMADNTCKQPLSTLYKFILTYGRDYCMLNLKTHPP